MLMGGVVHLTFDPSSTILIEKFPYYIKESWERCQMKKMTSSSMGLESMLSDYEMIEILHQYAELLHYSAPILEDLFNTINGTDFLVLIASPEGYIINSMGNPKFLKDANSIALRKGANWLEEFKGTNAIGTAIIEKKPVIVHGTHHYCRENQFLTCTAAPIHGPDGKLLGVLNISSYQYNFHPYSLGLIKRAAHSIEQALYIHQMKKKNNQAVDLDYAYQFHPASLITVSKDGIITRMNNAASQTIGSVGQGVIGKPISSLINGFHFSNMESAKDKKFTFKNLVFTTHMIKPEPDTGAFFILRGEKQNQVGELTNRYDFDDIICQDRLMFKTISIAKKVSGLDIHVLISGESGTGKELFAQSIHGASLRSHKPFIAINCSAIPESLLESELFGYEKGAFTGAKSGGQSGKFEAADGGTLFLDEIGDMPLAAQAALLRVIQEKCVTRVGGIAPLSIDVRIIAATHKNLLHEIEAGRFRADLYYRLNGFTLKLPPFRERSDLPVLADYILSRIPYSQIKPKLTNDAIEFILEYDWPGNFRQLQNILQQAFFLSNEQPISKPLLLSLCPSNQANEYAPKKLTKEQDSLSLREYETSLIQQTLEQCNGNISQTAKQLNIGRNTLYRKMKAFDLM